MPRKMLRSLEYETNVRMESKQFLVLRVSSANGKSYARHRAIRRFVKHELLEFTYQFALASIQMVCLVVSHADFRIVSLHNNAFNGESTDSTLARATPHTAEQHRDRMET